MLQNTTDGAVPKNQKSPPSLPPSVPVVLGSFTSNTRWSPNMVLTCCECFVFFLFSFYTCLLQSVCPVIVERSCPNHHDLIESYLPTCSDRLLIKVDCVIVFQSP